MEATTSELNLFLMPYIRAFQMLCISHFSIFRPELYKNRWRSVPYLVYFLLFISSHVVLTYFDCQLLLNMENKPNDKYSPLILLVNVMSVCGNFINHATLHIEALVQGKKERKLYRILNEINDIFATKLNHSMDYKGLRRKYARNMIPFFVIMAAVMFSVVYNSLSSLENRYMFMVFRIYTVIIICSREMYIALTLGILGDFLIHLKDALSNDSDQFQERIRYFRQIYSKIGLIKDLISDCFGWSLITFLIQFTFDLINLSYWLFINLTILKATVLSMSEILHNLGTKFHFLFVFFNFSYCLSYYGNFIDIRILLQTR